MSCPNEALNKLKLAVEDHSKSDADMHAKSKAFGNAIRDARRRAGVSRAKFCSALGYTATMVSYLESGERLWSLENAEKAIRIVNRGGAWPQRGGVRK